MSIDTKKSWARAAGTVLLLVGAVTLFASSFEAIRYVLDETFATDQPNVATQYLIQSIGAICLAFLVAAARALVNLFKAGRERWKADLSILAVGIVLVIGIHVTVGALSVPAVVGASLAYCAVLVQDLLTPAESVHNAIA